MAYVVTESCIKCKYTECVAVCPVDCFREGQTMLVIEPDECIDCGVCVPECPVEAIVIDSDPKAELFRSVNREYSALWPRISRKKPPHTDADRWRNAPNKFAEHFDAAPAASPLPASGDGCAT